jgi:hypothetical protein
MPVIIIIIIIIMKTLKAITSFPPSTHNQNHCVHPQVPINEGDSLGGSPQGGAGIGGPVHKQKWYHQ